MSLLLNNYGDQVEFNAVLDGYVEFAVELAAPKLEQFSAAQQEIIFAALREAFYLAKDMHSIEDAYLNAYNK